MHALQFSYKLAHMRIFFISLDDDQGAHGPHNVLRNVMPVCAHSEKKYTHTPSNTPTHTHAHSTNTHTHTHTHMYTHTHAHAHTRTRTRTRTRTCTRTHTRIHVHAQYKFIVLRKTIMGLMDHLMCCAMSRVRQRESLIGSGYASSA